MRNFIIKFILPTIKQARNGDSYIKKKLSKGWE